MALELPDRFKELRVFGESLQSGNAPLSTRSVAKIKGQSGHIQMDWHVLVIPGDNAYAKR